MAQAADFVRMCLAQRGDRYVYGAEARLDDPDPDVFDCSELVQWACARVGVPFPDGSQFQEAACRNAGLLIPIPRGVKTQGALLFRHRPPAAHVAVSLGNGMMPGPFGKPQNPQPQPPSISPRLYASSDSYPVIEYRAISPKFHFSWTLPPRMSSSCLL